MLIIEALAPMTKFCGHAVQNTASSLVKVGKYRRNLKSIGTTLALRATDFKALVAASPWIANFYCCTNEKFQSEPAISSSATHVSVHLPSEVDASQAGALLKTYFMLMRYNTICQNTPEAEPMQRRRFKRAAPETWH